MFAWKRKKRYPVESLRNSIFEGVAAIIGMSNLDEEIRHLREILTKRFIAAGIVTPRILALSQHLDTLIVERQLMDLPKRRILA